MITVTKNVPPVTTFDSLAPSTPAPNATCEMFP